MWDLYLNTIPPEHNQIFRVNRHYDATADRHFVRAMGNVVLLDKDMKLHSIWDVELPQENFFKDVCSVLSQTVLSKPIESFFVSTLSHGTVGVVGCAKPIRDNHDPDLYWDSFHTIVPSFLVNDNPGLLLQNVEQLKRAITTIDMDSFETVYDLCSSNSVYRGETYLPVLTAYKGLLQDIRNVSNLDYFLYLYTNTKYKNVIGIRNTAIGTLLVDLSEGKDLEQAVKAFEIKVAPSNYKRTTALITPTMIKQAEQTVTELGLQDSLERTIAVKQDIPVQHALFVYNSNPTVNTSMFDTLTEDVKKQAPKELKAIDISQEDFITKVLPTLSKLEILNTPNFEPNKLVLTKPVNEQSTGMFKWSNGFAWSYLSDTTDAIKERVKEAGGNITADLRFSLAWHSPCDLDLHLSGPNDLHVYFRNKKTSVFELDLDMNGLDKKDPDNPVENLIVKDKTKLRDGIYNIYVHNYAMRSPRHDSFKFQTEFEGQIHTYVYDKTLVERTQVPVCSLIVKKGNIEIRPSNSVTLTSSTSKQKFLTVDAVTYSPNYWTDDNSGVGLKQVFFYTNEVKMVKPVRGFFNEYLTPELNKHRKVFEILGAKTKIEPTDNGLTGFGFSISSKQTAIFRATDKAGKQLVYNVNF